MKELDYLKKLVSIKSFDIYENREIIEYLYKEFSKYAEEIIVLKNDNNDKRNLLISLNVDLKNISNAVVLSGHIDTVPANEKEYITNPYQPVVKNGKLYGLGSIDMKSFFACILANIKKLRGCVWPHCDCNFV
jgi:acetylornithine deacetylase